jgi:hypothetical protein
MQWMFYSPLHSTQNTIDFLVIMLEVSYLTITLKAITMKNVLKIALLFHLAISGYSQNTNDILNLERKKRNCKQLGG